MDDETQVKAVTNALLGTFSIGDIVHLCNIDKGHEWGHLNGSITVVVGINVADDSPYIIGIKNKQGTFLRSAAKYLQHHKIKEAP